MHGSLVIEPITGSDEVLTVLGQAFDDLDDFRFGESIVLSLDGGRDADALEQFLSRVLTPGD